MSTETTQENTISEGKTTAIIAYITIIGLIGLTILDWTQSCENCCYII